MLDRESTFANPNVVQFLKNNTVAVAIDQANQRRQKDTEGDYYRKIVAESPRKNFGNQTTQGLYMASADGTFLGFTNHRSPDRVMQMLVAAQEKYRPQTTAPLEAVVVDRNFNPQLPAGGLVVRVQAKILSGYDPPESRFQQIFQTALSRDNLWILPSEHKALAAGTVPDALAERIARFHLVDNTRGEPPMWRKSEIKESRWAIDGSKLTGFVQLKTADGKRSFAANIQGDVQISDGQVTRIDAVAHGMFSGDGPYTRGAPKGEFPLAISFTLADGSDIADGIAPQGARGWVDGYLKLQ